MTDQQGPQPPGDRDGVGDSAQPSQPGPPLEPDATQPPSYPPPSAPTSAAYPPPAGATPPPGPTPPGQMPSGATPPPPAGATPPPGAMPPPAGATPPPPAGTPYQGPYATQWPRASNRQQPQGPSAGKVLGIVLGAGCLLLVGIPALGIIVGMGVCFAPILFGA